MWQTTDTKDKPESMVGFKIHCFTCKKDAQKSSLRQHHLGHEVDWVQDVRK